MAGGWSRSSCSSSNGASSPRIVRLWRISDFADLDGVGGEYAAGRWHAKGRRIVYTAEHAALALLEALVRFDERRSELPPGYQLLRIEGPDLAPEEWTGPVPGTDASRAWGDEWLASGRSLYARVPAVVAPHSHNLLINPAHEAARDLKLVSVERWDWDARLLP